MRAAARMKKPKTLPEAVLRRHPCDPRAMRGRVRRACRFFLAEFETYRGYVEMAVGGCDGDNALVQRARDGLAAAHSAMQECLARHGYGNGAAKPNHQLQESGNVRCLAKTRRGKIGYR